MTYAEFSIVGEQILMAIRADQAWKPTVRGRYVEFLKATITKTEARIAMAREKFPAAPEIAAPLERMIQRTRDQITALSAGAEMEDELMEYRMRLAALPEPH